MRDHGTTYSGSVGSRSSSRAPTRPGTPQDFLIPVTFTSDGTLDPTSWQMLAHLREDKSGQFSHHNTRLVNVSSVDDTFHAPISSNSHHESGSVLMHQKTSSNPLSSNAHSPSNREEYHPSYGARPGTPSQPLHSGSHSRGYPPFEGHPLEGNNLPDPDKYSAYKVLNWDKLVSQSHATAIHHHRHRHHLAVTQPVPQRSS